MYMSISSLAQKISMCLLCVVGSLGAWEVSDLSNDPILGIQIGAGADYVYTYHQSGIIKTWDYKKNKVISQSKINDLETGEKKDFVPMYNSDCSLCACYDSQEKCLNIVDAMSNNTLVICGLYNDHIPKVSFSAHNYFAFTMNDNSYAVVDFEFEKTDNGMQVIDNGMQFDINSMEEE